jgi:glyoxylase-like metal-dependent hydrolase (beta-lactamase superfamily II)
MGAMTMKTVSIRYLLIALAVLAISTVSAHAQGDLSKVEIKATKITNNFYTLEGSGGTIGALVGPDGVLMVDAQFAPLTDKIVAAIKGISNGNIRYLINTHVHGDHTGGNENFAKLGVTLFSREELRDRLAHPAPNANGTPGTPAPPAALPVVTYTSKLTFHMNGDDVELIPVPKAHTDGDTLVRFPKQDVLMTGDYFRSLGYPNIDRANGGTLQGMLDGLALTISLCGPNTKVIPGHGVIVDKAALTAHRDMIIAIRDRVGQLVKQGKTLEEVVAAKPTSDYDSKVPGVGTTGERFIGQLYAELKPAK